jgi:sec-independent protein translocase protein TatA
MFTGLESPTKLLILLGVVLLVFGAKRLPEIGRSLGTGMREFKDSISGPGEDENASGQAVLPAAAEEPKANELTI